MHQISFYTCALFMFILVRSMSSTIETKVKPKKWKIASSDVMEAVTKPTKRSKKICTKCQKSVFNINRHLVSCIGICGNYRNVKIMPELVAESQKKRNAKVNIVIIPCSDVLPNFKMSLPRYFS